MWSWFIDFGICRWGLHVSIKCIDDNTFIIRMSRKVAQKLQLVQNRAARLLTGYSNYRENISFERASLTAIFQVQFKVLFHMVKAINNLGSVYLQDHMSIKVWTTTPVLDGLGGRQGKGFFSDTALFMERLYYVFHCLDLISHLTKLFYTDWSFTDSIICIRLLLSVCISLQMLLV